METTTIREREVTRDWYVVNAKGRTLGRLASQIAQIIRGKNKPYFSPNMDMGDFVIVVNAGDVAISGNKEEDKKYFRHSGYPGGATLENLKTVRSKQPEKILYNAVKGMLPHNRLGRKLINHLKIYNSSEHPHGAQMPKEINF